MIVSAHRPGSIRQRLYASTTDTCNGDLDYIAIEQAMNGEAPDDLTLSERIEAARQLASRGINLTEVGRRVGRDRSIIVGWQNNGWKQPGQCRPDSQPIDIGDAHHGRSGYSKGCRCRTCRDGAAAASRIQRAKAKEATTT
ncbi:hypothetical protein [Streptomyces sp. NPDC059176]|uniref:hypothetical protein n=1 Tax=Streptomyces sp. NPDC059176 TaxID=3346758 RepID=UPI00369CE0E4